MFRLARLFFGLLLLFLVSLTIPATAHAATPARVCLARLHGTPGEVEQLMAQPNRFDCASPQNAQGSGDFLAQLRFAPASASRDDPLVLRVASVWQGPIRIHFRYADGSTAELSQGRGAAGRYMTLGAIFEYPVPVRSAPLEAVFIEARDSMNIRGVVLGPTFMTHSESNALKSRLIALYAGFAGLSIALVLYNLSLWAALRHRFQIVYCLMVSALAAYTFTSSGALLLAVPGMDNNDRLRINYVLLALSGVAAMQFFRHFFGRMVVGPRLDRTIFWMTGAVIASASAFALLAPWQGLLLDRIYDGALTAYLMLVFPLILAARRARSRFLGLFLLAWSAPILTSAARAAYGFNLIPYSFWLDNGNLIALSIESMLSTLLISARLRELSSERDLARAGEQSALRLANSDPLTGLLNRRAFMQMAIGRKARQRLMLIDIDRFKVVNDRFGHDIGDEVLREVAKAIQSLRPADSLAVRLGGEEFALLLPLERIRECTPEDLLAAVRAQPMPMGAQVTVSIGYAEGRVGSESDWKRLYRLADAALYRAKADGRDRACRTTDFTVVEAA